MELRKLFLFFILVLIPIITSGSYPDPPYSFYYKFNGSTNTNDALHDFKSSPNPVQLFFSPQELAGEPNDIIQIGAIISSGGETVSGIQFSVNWDPSVLTYIGSATFNPPVGGTTGINDDDAPTGQFIYNWFAPDQNGQPFNDFQLVSFTFQLNSCINNAIEFSDNPILIEISGANQSEPLGVTLENGNIYCCNLQGLESPANVEYSCQDPASGEITAFIDYFGSDPNGYAISFSSGLLQNPFEPSQTINGTLELTNLFAGDTWEIELGNTPSTFQYCDFTVSGTVPDDVCPDLSCSLADSGLQNIACDNNATPADPNDDFITFSLNPSGLNTGMEYTVTVDNGTISPSIGIYGSPTNFQLSPGSAGNGDVLLTITDVDAPTCSLTQTITDPGSCSTDCPITALDSANQATFSCLTTITGIQNDEVLIELDYVGSAPGISIQNNGNGTIGGDDPALTPDGTITISGLTEGDQWDIAITGNNCNLSSTGIIPFSVCDTIPCTIYGLETGNDVWINCLSQTTDTDAVTVEINYIGLDTNAVLINQGNGIIGGDDPSSISNGTIILTGLEEGDSWDLSLVGGECNYVSTGTIPGTHCDPGFCNAPDTIPPSINAPGNKIIPCFSFDPEDYDGVSDTPPGVPVVAGGQTIGFFDAVNDNCIVDSVLVTDLLIPSCTESWDSLIRRYTVVDTAGNSAFENQLILLERGSLDSVIFPPNYDGIDQPILDCSNPCIDPACTGMPIVMGCSFTMTFEDTQIPVCEGSYKLLREWKVVDNCTLDSVLYNQIIDVEDQQPPIIACPSDLTINAHNSCTGSLILPTALTSDSCSSSPLVTIKDGLGATFAQGDTIQLVGTGDYTFTYIGSDDCGNIDSCLFIATNEDNLGPTITCPQNTTIDCGTFEEDVFEGVTATPPGAPVFYNGSPIGFYPDASDNCNVISVTITQDTTLLNQCGVGSVIRNYTAEDNSGNTTSCEQVITIENLVPFDICDIQCWATPETGCNGHSLTDGVEWPCDIMLDQCNADLTPDGLDVNPTIHPFDVRPRIFENACDLVAVTYEDTLLFSNPPACQEILRTWVVIDWCNPDNSFPTGFQTWEYEQLIVLNNGSSPVITSNCDDLFICLNAPGCDTVTSELFIDALDDCTPVNNLTFSYEIDLFNDATIDLTETNNPQAIPGNSPNEANGNYPFGTHAITWTVEDGCGNSTSCSYLFTVFAGDPLMITAQIEPPDCFGGISGSIQLTTSGGTAPYLFDWADLPGSDNPEDRFNLGAGTYFLTLTDQNNQELTDSFVITQPSQLDLSISSTSAQCIPAASGSIDLEITGGTPGYSFDWDNAPDVEDPTGLTPGTYTVVVTDANGCTITTSTTIPSQSISINPLITAVNCPDSMNGAIFVEVIDGSGDYQFNWSPALGNVQTAQDLAAGIYEVTVTDNANGCSATETIIIPVAGMYPVVDLGNDLTLCSDNPFTLNAGNPGATFLWSTGDTTQLIAVSQAANYSVTVSDAFGCSSEDGVQIDIDQSELNVDLGMDTSICEGDILTLFPLNLNPTTSIWNTGATTPSIDIMEAGSYSVTVTAIEACQSAGDLVFLPDGTGEVFESNVFIDEFDPNDSLQTGADLYNICINLEHSWLRDLEISLTCPSGESIILHDHPGQTGGETFLGIPVEGDENGTPIPGTGYNYCWTPDATNGTWLEYANQNNAQTLPPGDYQPYESFDSLIGCPLNGTWTISIEDLWLIDNGTIFNWSIILENSLDTLMDADTININTIPPPSLDLGPDTTILEGESILLNAFDPNCTDCTYLWNDGNTDSIRLFTPTMNTTLWVTVTNSLGCSETDSLSIEVLPLCYVPPSLSCSNAVPICGLNSFCSDNSLGNGPSDVPPTLPCSQAGAVTIENNVWFAFVAGYNDLTLSIEVPNCEGSFNPPGGGIQVLIFDNCQNFNQVSDCFNPGMQSDGIINATNLTIGATYYILVDGWAGDVCDFTMTVTQGSINPPAPDPPTTITGPAIVCPGSQSAYTTPNTFAASAYQWIAPPGAIILNGNGTNAIAIDWGNSMGGSLCVFAENGCGISDTFCIAVMMENEIVTNLSDTICEDALPYLFNDIPINAGGTYADTLINGVGCDSIVNLSLTIIPAIPPTALEETICEGTTYELPDPDGNGMLSFDQAGIYEVAYPSSVDCDSIVQLQLNVIEINPLVIPSDTLNCVVDQITLDASGSGGPNLSYSWSTSDGSICSAPNMASIDICAPGTYNLTLIGTDNSATCFETIGFEAPANYLTPSAQIAPAGILTCSNDTITLTGLTDATNTGLPFTASWYDNQGALMGNELNIEVTTPGWYFFEVRYQESQCAALDSVLIEANFTAPEMLLVNNTGEELITCNTPVIQLESVLMGSLSDPVIQWSSPDGGQFLVISSDSTLVEVDTAGTYQLTIIDPSNGCLNAQSITLGINQETPVASILDPDTLNCAQPTQVLNGSTSEYGPNVILDWSTPNGNIVSGETTILPVINAAGAYILKLTDTLNGCSDITAVEVVIDTLHPIIRMEQPDEITCYQTNITLDASNSSQDIHYEYLWTGPGQIDQFNTTMPTIYTGGTFTFTITNPFNGCFVDSTIQVPIDTVGPQVFAGNNDTLSCFSDQLQLENTTINGPYTQFGWVTDNGTFISSPNVLYPTIEGPGTYIFTAFNNSNGCTDSSMVQIIEQNYPKAMIESVGEENYCLDSIILTAQLPIGYEGEWWSTSPGVVIETPLSPTTKVTNLSYGKNIFFWTLSSPSDECYEFSTDTIVITLPVPPRLEDDSVSVIQGENPIRLNIWDNDQLNDADEESFFIEQPVPGLLNDLENGDIAYEYPPNFSGMTAFRYRLCTEGCPNQCDTAVVKLEVKFECGVDSLISIPNVLTPDGDGLNDTWIINALINCAYLYPDNELVITNRWGDVVYEAKPYRNDWGGTNQNGKILPQGTYYYILRLSVGEGVIFRGWLTIVGR